MRSFHQPSSPYIWLHSLSSPCQEIFVGSRMGPVARRASKGATKGGVLELICLNCKKAIDRKGPVTPL